MWLEASAYVRGMQLEEPPKSASAWNDALEQAARALERHASETKQANGMYYRVMDGKSDATE